MVTVYRSGEMNAEQDALSVRNLLVRNGMEAELLDDNSPGVESGNFAVQVPEAQFAEAQALLAEANSDEERRADPSRELDMVTLRRTMGSTGEMEAISIKSILDANGINNMISGNSTLPSLSFFVLVPRAELERAESVIAEAQAAGPAAAVEASEQMGENPDPDGR